MPSSLVRTSSHTWYYNNIWYALFAGIISMGSLMITLFATPENQYYVGIWISACLLVLTWDYLPTIIKEERCRSCLKSSQIWFMDKPAVSSLVFKKKFAQVLRNQPVAYIFCNQSVS